MCWFKNTLGACLIGVIFLNGCYRASVQRPTGVSAIWKIRTAYKLDGFFNRPDTTYIDDLVARLESEEGGGIPVSRNEFLALLDRPESQEIYRDQLVKIATPRSVQIQNQEHRDFLNVFMMEKRLKAGVAFLHDQGPMLAEAETRYGVRRRDIVSILMWESGLGEFTGELKVFSVLMGQLLFLDSAQKYAVAQMVERGEASPLDDTEVVALQKKRFNRIKNRCVGNLVALLRQSKAANADPLEQLGSWGGAIGYPQFMPFSMGYAVDGDQDGTVNLHTWPDAIMSVGNYLKVRGKYGPEEGERLGAIHSYNPIESYVNGVITYADAIWERYLRGE
ncbi:MAG: lytic murein transglycosylase [Gemmatimonadota bacterium]|nr:lytic murein transglycosylase [Gemmatimonadota bacterium]